MHRPFLFSTGIENSYPVLPNGRRVDEMEKCGHYDRWREDFALVKEIGATALRYGPAYYKTHVGPNKFDWSSADEPIHALRDEGIELIADLCHFGVPDWLGGFQDPAFPVLFAEYARAFARRYPWVRYYTPVNEIYTCASFSALRGFWNESLASEAAFARAMRNMCMGHELAIEAILAERPDAIIIQSESIEGYPPAGRTAEAKVERENAFKHLSLDLTLGRDLAPGMASFLNKNGVTSNELSFFREKRAVGQRWLGVDYYPASEHRVPSTGKRTTAHKGVGFRLLAAEYYSRYRIPLFHCETNRVSPLAVDWLAGQWSDIEALRKSGIPVMGFAWFSLTDQIDWQHALRVEKNEVHSVGLYDLKRQIRPVGVAYRDLIAANREMPALPFGVERKEA